MIPVLVLAFGIVGWALEVAHPVFFAREPVVVWTKAHRARAHSPLPRHAVARGMDVLPGRGTSPLGSRS